MNQIFALMILLGMLIPEVTAQKKFVDTATCAKYADFDLFNFSGINRLPDTLSSYPYIEVCDSAEVVKLRCVLSDKWYRERTYNKLYSYYMEKLFPL